MNHEPRESDGGDQPVEVTRVEGSCTQIDTGDVRDSKRTAGQRAPVDRYVLHDQPERDGDHSEVDPAHAHGGVSERDPRDRGDDSRTQHRREEACAGFGGKNGNRVGPQRVEPRLTE